MMGKRMSILSQGRALSLSYCKDTPNWGQTPGATAASKDVEHAGSGDE